jgi:GNAT superfamily N-acetyltransferase
MTLDMRPILEELDESNSEAALKQALNDPLNNALIIANLTQLKADCSIVVRRWANNINAIASYYRDLPFHSLALMGEQVDDITETVRNLTDRFPHLKTEPVYGLYSEKVANLIQQCFTVENEATELQMALRQYPIAEIPYDKTQYRLERLTPDDMVQISHLYSLVPAMAWTPKALTFGPCYGVYYNEKLVSIAGVHFSTKSVAEIGNIVTHPNHRRLNLAYACTKAVADALAKTSDNIFLCVMADNEPAIRLYEKMGFVTNQEVYLMRYRIS